MHARIKTADLESGMVLATDVHEKSGRFLLGEGCELQDKHIRALKAWGVVAVVVFSDDLEFHGEKIGREIDKDLLEKLTLDMDTRFIHTDRSDAFISELYTEVLNRNAKREGTGE